MKLDPLTFSKIEGVYRQKNGLLRFRGLALQKDLRELNESILAMDFAISGNKMLHTKLRYDFLNDSEKSVDEVLRLNAKILQLKERRTDLENQYNEISARKKHIEDEIVRMAQLEIKNDIRCDFLKEIVVPFEDEGV